MAFLLSPDAGTYFMTTVWSGSLAAIFPVGSKSLEFCKMSEMHSDFDVYFDLNCFSDDKFLPSLFPKWLYETIDFGLIPAPIKKSMNAVLNFVWPVLKSFPT